ncbi:MAG: PQQ-binding-like beta-propeller repeat protein [Bacillota bacterium]|nr:PQQ-binding-like beta-propeller repeat protein [Bacillota bacterium]
MRFFVLVPLICLALSYAPRSSASGTVFWRNGVHEVPVPVDMYRRWEFSAGSMPLTEPVTDGSLLFFGDDAGTLYALDASTGESRWAFATDPKSPIRMMPAVEGQVVYFGTVSGQIYALSAGSGGLVWRADAAGWVTGSPVTYGGHVAVTCYDGRVLALSCANGAEVWRHSTGGEFLRAPLVLAGDHIVYGGLSGSVVSLDARTGVRRWSQTLPGWVSGLVFDGQALYASAVGPRTGGIHRLELQSGEIRWRHQSPSNNYWSSPAVDGDRVYAGNLGSLVCLGKNSGECAWTYGLPPVTLTIGRTKRQFYPSVGTPFVGPWGAAAPCSFEVKTPHYLVRVTPDGLPVSRYDLGHVPSATLVTHAGIVYVPGTSGVMQALSGVTVALGQKRIPFSTAGPVIMGGSTLCPVRMFAEECGSQVSWDPVERSVTISRGATTVKMVIGSDVVLVNGTTRVIPAPAMILHDRTYVPLRFLASTLLSAGISWDQRTLTATVDMR